MQRKLTEIAHGLDLPLSTLNRWIRQGRIPVQKSGDNGSFDETVLKEWASRHNLCFSPDRDRACSRIAPRPETLSSAMRNGRVFRNITGDHVEAVLSAAAGVIPGLSEQTRRELYDRLLERERLTSTGIGKGVAIPHPRTPIIRETETAAITTCFLEHPIEFGAVDDQPVFILFVLLSPSVKVHLHLLSRLAFCVRDDAFVDFLRTIPQPDDLLMKIAEFEKRLED